MRLKMTMSVHQTEISEMAEKEKARNELSLSENTVTSLPMGKSSMKRSFDVAFLISQDDKSKQKQIRINKQATLFHSLNFNAAEVKNFSDNSNSTIEDIHRTSPDTKIPPYHKYVKSPSPNPSATILPEIMKYHPHRYISASHSPPKIFDDPRAAQHFTDRTSSTQPVEQKSAFTKVKLDNRMVSPNHSISPELNYQNSLSPSPPILNTYVQKSFQNLMPQSPNTSLFKSTLPPYPSQFVEQTFPGTSTDHHMFPAKSAMEQHQHMLFKNHQNEIFTPKLRQSVLNYRPELPAYAYPSIGGAFQSPDMVKFPPTQDIIKLQANPAAAILNSLLPPSFAALSLPAQNVCAKCNISFRMTSDLVYHMRSHHKSEVANDNLKKRREDKLKCPVCSESFRERHHLTRHMTAHQDKEGDCIDDQLPVSTAGSSSQNAGPALQNGGGRKVRNMQSGGGGGAAFNNVFCK